MFKRIDCFYKSKGKDILGKVTEELPTKEKVYQGVKMRTRETSPIKIPQGEIEGEIKIEKIDEVEEPGRERIPWLSEVDYRISYESPASMPYEVWAEILDWSFHSFATFGYSTPMLKYLGTKAFDDFQQETLISFTKQPWLFPFYEPPTTNLLGPSSNILEEIANNFETYLYRWLQDLSKKYEDSLRFGLFNYLLTLYYSMPKENRLLNLVSSLEALRRMKNRAEAILLPGEWGVLKEEMERLIEEKVKQEEAKDKLKGKLDYFNEVSLRHRLKKIVEKIENNFKERKGEEILNKDEIDQIVDLRNYYTHLSVREGDEEKIEQAKEKIESLYIPKLTELTQWYILECLRNTNQTCF